MRPRLILFLLISLLLPTLCLAAPKKKTSTDRRIAPTARAATDGEKRIALVIGNSSYAASPLKNPVNDAKDVGAKLRKLGFTVIERSNLTTKQIGGTLREFSSKLEPGAVALVFYAGHGLQIKGENYLPAVDAEIQFEEDVPNQSLSMKQIMDLLDDSKTRLNLVFLDACRNNPYARSFRSAGNGLARVSAPSGTLISYATRPGSVAADGSGRNGLYTSKLLAQMDSSQQIEQALKHVVTDVKAASNGKQEPWMEGSIEGDFCFAGCSAGGQTGGNAGDAEKAAWQAIENEQDPSYFRDFLKEYPNSSYAGAARLKLKQLEKKQSTDTTRVSAEATSSPAVTTVSGRFTDNGNGTVYDSKTGLVWLKNANCFGRKDWQGAMNAAKNLASGECGLTDGSRAGNWRLPSKEEWEQFVDTSRKNPALPAGHPFDGVQNSGYWSSSTFANITDRAWYVFMYYGVVYTSEKTRIDTGYVWPVRGGQ